MRIPLDTGWLDLEAGQYLTPDSAEALRPMETRLLRYLAHRPGEAVHQDELLAEVWGYSPRVRSRTVRSTVSRIRSRIEATPAEPRHLLTRPGLGYELVPGAMGKDRSGSGLVGRDGDLEALRNALERTGILLLVGPGGVGKTALARVVASGIPGALWLDGRAASTAEELAAVAAASLEGSAEDLVARLATHALIVVDDADEVEGLAPMLESWARQVPRLLVTSRVRIPVVGAGVYELAPLDGPAMTALLDRVWSRSALDRDVELAPLVPMLGGLPLAAELVSAWAPLMSPRQLASRLGTTAIADPERDDRQGSLQRVLEESLSLLRAAELDALTALAVCPGGVSPEDAEALVPTEPLPSLLVLRRHSLVQRSRSDEGSERFELLPPVRRHVLRTRPTDEARRRQALRFANRARTEVQRLRTPDDGAAWQWLVTEAANLRAASRFPELSPPLRLALVQGLDQLGLILGPRALHEEDLEAARPGLDADGRQWWGAARARQLRIGGALEDAVGAALAVQSDGPWASFAAEELARCLVFVGRTEEAWEASQRALAFAREPMERAEAERGLAKLYRMTGDSARAIEGFEKAHAIAANGPRAQLAIIKSDLGEHLGERTKERALELFEEALELQERFGLHRDRAITVLRRGVIGPRDRRTEDYRTARGLAEEYGWTRVKMHADLRLAQWSMEIGDTTVEPAISSAIEAAEKLGDPNLVAILQLNRAHLRVERGAFEEAELDYSAALTLHEGIGMPLYAGTAWAMSGMGSFAAGDLDRARERLEQALVCWSDFSIGRAQVLCLMSLLDGDPTGIDDLEQSAPWFRWAFAGGDPPTEPPAETSWLARRVRDWVKRADQKV